MSALKVLLDHLPIGAIITRRAGSWAVEIPTAKGYLSCGFELESALEYAMSVAPQKALANLDALGGLTLDRTESSLAP